MCNREFAGNEKLKRIGTVGIGRGAGFQGIKIAVLVEVNEDFNPGKSALEIVAQTIAVDIGERFQLQRQIHGLVFRRRRAAEIHHQIVTTGITGLRTVQRIGIQRQIVVAADISGGIAGGIGAAHQRQAVGGTVHPGLGGFETQ